ncbi:hypothetical protein BKA64DRAFT_769402 [Cadophora sp. MPI-SDFR-AT-0126]|nr:hypothetical protein BKA64DRAFT_769402 [Leotiomycetes sp. MPI-SDFR-AT-0126]
MTIPKSLQEIAGTEKATIFVGPNKVEFKVLKNIICQASDFFSAAFQDGFQESTLGSIHMPEDDPVTFQRFLSWVYGRKLPQSKGTTGQKLLYDLYILAEKLCMNDLANKTMDRIRESHENTFTTSGATDRNLKHVGDIFDRTAQSSPLRDFMLYIMVHDIYYAASKARQGGLLISREDLMEIWNIGQDHPEFYEEFFARLLRIGPVQSQARRPKREDALAEVRDFLYSGTRCIFHKHSVGELCYLEEDKGDAAMLLEQTSSTAD